MTCCANVLDFIPATDHAAIRAGTSTTDHSPAFRQAYDALPDSGGDVIVPCGTYNIQDTVIVPIKGYGVNLIGQRAHIRGPGPFTGTIFESGKTSYSVNGLSNWGYSDEQFIHLGNTISGFTFSNFQYAIKIFNWLWNSKVSHNWFSDGGETAIYARRCFYAEFHKIYSRLGYVGRDDESPQFLFEEANNAQLIQGNHAGGIVGGASRTGTGFLFLGGVASPGMGGNTAEGCVTGLRFTGEIDGLLLSGWFFEANTAALDLGGAGKVGLIVEGNWFEFNDIDVGSAGGWVSGRLGANHFSIGSVCQLAVATNTMEIHLSPSNLTSAQAAVAPQLPPGWTASPSATVYAPRMIFNATIGLTAPREVNRSQTTPAGLVSLAYSGDTGDYPTGEVAWANGFLNLTSPGPGNFIIDTNWRFGQYAGGLSFYFVIDDNGTVRSLHGKLHGGNLITRGDSQSAIVAASNAAGLIRFTIGSFTNASLITGKVYL